MISTHQADSSGTGYITGPNLVLIAFATVFFSRIVDTLGAPGPINFVHFLMVPLALFVALSSARVSNREQVITVQYLAVALCVLLGLIIVSALLNQAGAINVVLDFLLLSEPYLFLIAIISLPLTRQSLKRFKKWIFRFLFINLGLAALQSFVIVPYFRQYLPHTTLLPSDMVQGVFFISGGGHNTSSVVTIVFGLYYIQSQAAKNLWLKGAMGSAIVWQILASDSKATLLSFILAAMLLGLTKVKDIGKFLSYVVGAIALSALFLWCVYNLDAFSGFRGALNLSLYTTENKMVLLKLSPLRIIPAHYVSDLNFWLGLGPGHTVSRLGGWMLEKYSGLLAPLGPTTHPVSSEVWDEIRRSFYAGKTAVSSFYHPLWGWAGLWGDLGVLGVCSYVSLACITWSRLCKSDLAKLCILRTAWSGLIMAQIEDPGIMLAIALIIGVLWHEHRLTQSALTFTKRIQWQHQNRLRNSLHK